MTDRDRGVVIDWLKARIQELRSKAADIEGRRKALEEEQRLVQRELDAALVLHEAESGQPLQAEQPEQHRYDRMSLPRACEEVLASADGPLHAAEIRRRIQAVGARANTSISSFIAAMSRDKERFVRVRDGTYDLRERRRETSG